MRDPDDLNPQPIRYEGTQLGVVTALSENRCRLVLKPAHDRFPALRKLARERDGPVIDVDRSAEWVKEQVIRLAKQKRKEETPEPSGGEPYQLEGHTYPVRETLKEFELRWDSDKGVWYTHDPDKWERAISALGAQKTGERTAHVPKGATPSPPPPTRRRGKTPHPHQQRSNPNRRRSRSASRRMDLAGTRPGPAGGPP